MAKPAYSLVYAILIAIGLLALVLFNRMLGSDDAAPAAQASMQRNEAAAREVREAQNDAAERPAATDAREPRTAADKAEQAQEKGEQAARTNAPGKDEEERK